MYEPGLRLITGNGPPTIDTQARKIRTTGIDSAPRRRGRPEICREQNGLATGAYSFHVALWPIRPKALAADGPLELLDPRLVRVDLETVACPRLSGQGVDRRLSFGFPPAASMT